MTEEEDNRGSAGRRDYDDANAALGRHIKENDHRLRRFFIGALIAFSIIGLATAAALVGFGIVLNEQQKTQDQLKVLVAQAKQTARDIQQQRKDAIRTECTNTNKRHDGSIDALIKGSDQDQANAPNEAARKEIRRRRDVTIALLDALAPHQDCEQLIKDSVKPTGG